MSEEMSEERPVYRVEIPLALFHEIGLDPDALPEHHLLQIKGSRSLQLCESLFWAVTQLSLLPDHGGQVYSPAALNQALGALGQLGQALASSAGEHLQRLEHLAEQARKGRQKR